MNQLGIGNEKLEIGGGARMMAEHKKKSVGRDALIPPGKNANHLPQTYKRICRGRCLHRPAGGSLLHLPLFIRLCVGNHPSPALPELPSKGSRRGF